MEDVDMMEVDEDHLDHSKAVKRLPNGQLISNKRANEAVDCVHGPRKKIRAKRLIKRSGGKFIIVLDTNILINHLSDLKTFLSNTHLVESCSLIIPLIVIQELDCLKKTNQSFVQNFKFINEQLRAGKALFSDKIWLKKYPPDKVEAALARIDVTEINNDDRVLKASLLINEISAKSDNTVILVTDDLNLRNKALAATLKVTDWGGFCDKFGIESTSKSKTGKIVEKFRPATKKINVQINKDRKTDTTSSSKTDFSTDTMQFGDWLTLKYSAEIKLKAFMEKILRKEYDDLWDKIFKINFSNCSLFEIIRCLKHGWLGTFSDIFNRDKEVYQTIETMFELLKTEKNTNELTTLIHNFLQLVDKIEEKLDKFCDSSLTKEKISQKS